MNLQSHSEIEMPDTTTRQNSQTRTTQWLRNWTQWLRNWNGCYYKTNTQLPDCSILPSIQIANQFSFILSQTCLSLTKFIENICTSTMSNQYNTEFCLILYVFVHFSINLIHKTEIRNGRQLKTAFQSNKTNFWAK